MQNVHHGRRLARGVAVALLILATALIALPGSASANRGRGYAWGRHRVSGYAAVRYAPRYRYSHAYYRPYGYGYVSYYRPYRYYAFRPHYRVVVADPYWYDDDDYYARPVVVYRHHRPRVGVSLMFSSGPGVYYGGYGDPYCDW